MGGKPGGGGPPGKRGGGIAGTMPGRGGGGRPMGGGIIIPKKVQIESAKNVYYTCALTWRYHAWRRDRHHSGRS